MAVKLSDTMMNELRYAAENGYQGELVYTSRRTEEALRRRGLITRDYDNVTFATSKWGYRNFVLTVAGWAVIGERPADPDRLSLEEAWDDAHAKATPVACCEHAPMYHGARGCDECGCATPRNTESKEDDDVSIKEGPLTERQIRIINYLREGKRHEEIASLLEDIGVNMVKRECQHIRSKFRTHTVTQAVSLWATAQAYRETATLIGSHRPSHVDNEVDVHVDHVLYGLIQILRERADRLTPR